MSVALTLDLKTWQPGEPERIYTAHELRERYLQLQKDMKFLAAVMLDNFGCNLVIDGNPVSRMTFMYDGENSPDLMYLFEEHIVNIYKNEPTMVQFFEERMAWRFKPDDSDSARMQWEVVDLSQGEARATVTNNGTCERLPFIDGAFKWLKDARETLERYREDIKKAGGEDPAHQIEICKKLFEYSSKVMREQGYEGKG
jgi:hypothetical protein